MAKTNNHARTGHERDPSLVGEQEGFWSYDVVCMVQEEASYVGKFDDIAVEGTKNRH